MLSLRFTVLIDVNVEVRTYVMIYVWRVWTEKTHNLKAENYFFLDRLSENLSVGHSNSDSSEGPPQRGRGGAWM